MRKNTVAVSFIGLGYVGLCTATVFAARGIKTLGVDIDRERVAEIADGKTPFHEPRLEPLLKKALKQRKLEATTDISRVDETASTFITVGTPSNPDGSIDLGHVKNATQNLVELSEKLLGQLNNRRIAVLGLAFKKDTGDIREAASVRLIDKLLKKGAHIVAYDPAAIPNAKKLLVDSVEFAENSHSAIRDADCCIIMTEWDEFKKLKAKDYLAEMRAANIVDARKLYDPEDFKDVNFQAIGLGN